MNLSEVELMAQMLGQGRRTQDADKRLTCSVGVKSFETTRSEKAVYFSGIFLLHSVKPHSTCQRVLEQADNQIEASSLSGRNMQLFLAYRCPANF